MSRTVTRPNGYYNTITGCFAHLIPVFVYAFSLVTNMRDSNDVRVPEQIRIKVWIPIRSVDAEKISSELTVNTV